MSLGNNPTFNQLVKAVKELENTILNQSGIVEISTQYIRVSTLDSGVYKLTYNGTKYLYISGNTSNTTSLTLSSNTVILFVSATATTGTRDWMFLGTSTVNGSTYTTLYSGRTTANGGTYSKLALERVVTIDDLPLFTGNPHSATINYNASTDTFTI